jgi:cell division protein FtsL
MAHNPGWANDRWELRRSLASLKSPNITLKAGAEFRAFAVWLATFVLLSVLIALGHVWLRIQVIELGYDRSATNSIIQKLELEAQRLAARVETLESPARLEKVARGRFEMIRTVPGQQAKLP